MKSDRQGDLFDWARSRPSAEIIDLIPIIVRNMAEVDPQYPTPAQVIRPDFSDRNRGAA